MKVEDVADFFLIFGAVDKSKGYNPRTLITNQRIQKLIFFAQLLHIQKHGQKLFEEEMEAWQFGPVVRKVYARFTKYGSLDIQETPKELNETDFDEGEIQTIKEVLYAVHRIPTYMLIETCHQHVLWKNTWHNEHRVIDFDVLLKKGGN